LGAPKKLSSDKKAKAKAAAKELGRSKVEVANDLLTQVKDTFLKLQLKVLALLSTLRQHVTCWQS
jgi:hypothetical protein